MKGKKRVPKKTPYIPPDPSANIAQGEHCVYCGADVPLGNPPFLASAHTRYFPVCSEACRWGTEDYVARDKQKKKNLYILLFFCAIGVLASALFAGLPYFMYAAILAGGLGFIFFPYPITSFETFLGCPIKRVEAICRAVGILLFVLGIFFGVMYMLTT